MSTDTGAVVVGIDGSEAALGAARWAADFAAKSGSPLQLLHAIPRLEWYFANAMVFSPDALADELATDGDKKLDVAEAEIRASHPELPVTRRIVNEAAAKAFAVASDTARLIVIGSHWSSAASDLILGGHVIRIVNQATCPVLVWRETEATRTGKPLPVVVGVDESDNSLRALRAAFATAEVLGAPLTVAHMWETGAAVGLGYGEGPVDWNLLHLLQSTQEEKLNEIVAPLRKEFPGAHVHKVYTDVGPAKGLKDLSKEAQLVVVGSKGHGKLSGAILGSVSQSLIHHAECSVLVTP
ncbi:universal stress protein [Williamsia sp. 1135]|uniref:universal stress protein n=1 Tax=Williamsia sp. 1135 TaxID=1889262 RepID=UPI000A111B55|nr:universal stress protein [Williamsia sp. 1135]ORM33443.1 universal stress protein UspA [Williamsia sp. 1135]